MAPQLTARQFASFLRDLDGISKRTLEEHYKLYQGYVNKYNEIMQKIHALGPDDYKAANATYSPIRELKVELARAMGGVKNHEMYFAHLGGNGGRPSGGLLQQIEKDFGSYDNTLTNSSPTSTGLKSSAATTANDCLAMDGSPDRQVNRP